LLSCEVCGVCEVGQVAVLLRRDLEAGVLLGRRIATATECASGSDAVPAYARLFVQKEQLVAQNFVELYKKKGLDATKIVGITTLGIAKGIVEACAKFCTEAVLSVSVLLVNYVVPATAELYKKKGLDALKIVGITLDVT